MLKRTIALLLAVVLCLGILAGCDQTKPEETTKPTKTTTPPATNETTTPVTEATEPTPTKLFDEPITINYTFYDAANQPFSEDWYILDALQNATNVTLNKTVYPGSDYAKKVETDILQGKVPDLAWHSSKTLAITYGPQGAFINVLDYVDQMPNFKAWLDANPERAARFLSADGSMYWFPTQGLENLNRRGWLFREDILAEHNLKVPTTQEEFYNLLVQLKQLYPDSYPLAVRSMTSSMPMLCFLSASFGAFVPYNSNVSTYDYSYETGEWFFGPVQDEFKEALEFYHKLYEEKLLIPNFLTVDKAGWTEAMTTGTSFITYDVLTNIDTFNITGKQFDADYKLNYMAPIAMGTNGAAQTYYDVTGDYGYTVSATCDEETRNNILKYIDWMYSDEGKQLMSWGEVGVTCEYDADGNLKWTEDVLKEVAADANYITLKLGLGGTGFYLLYDINAGMATYSEDLINAFKQTDTYAMVSQPVLSYDELEQKVYAKLAGPMKDYMRGEVSKFLLGERSFDSWDKYVEEVMAYDPDGELLTAHKTAYERIQKALGK